MTKEEVYIQPYIMNSLDLSDKEMAVFRVLVNFQFAKTVSQIARMAGLARSTVVAILNRFEKRRMVTKLIRKNNSGGKKIKWIYRKGYLENIKLVSAGKITRMGKNFTE